MNSDHKPKSRTVWLGLLRLQVITGNDYIAVLPAECHNRWALVYFTSDLWR